MFKLPERVVVFEFDEEGHEYHGLHVRLRVAPIPLATYLGLAKRAEVARDLSEPDAVYELLGDFADAALVSWDLVDRDDRPIPADRGGIIAVPIQLSSLLIREWISAVGRVPVPLGRRSPSGEPSPEDGTTKKAASSRSRRSSRKPS